MNTRKNALLTYVRRLAMVLQMTVEGLTASANKWLGRYLAAGEAGLGDRSSKAALSPRQIPAGKALAIVELRRKRLT